MDGARHPGPQDDPGRPTIRVGYAELRVTPEVKRLAVTLDARARRVSPGRLGPRSRLACATRRSSGPRSEVTLWAVDEGVLSLTGYTTPDPIDLIYRERGLGLRLASNMTTVAPQVPEGMKGTREPGGGGGAAGADILRSRFQTTAFFLGSVVTDAQGNAVVTAKLPDNLTTFRVMAVAVTAGDRYGKGQSSLLVTRPLLARQALPRFVRPGDDFTAGAVINRRDGTAASVKVTATATGVTLRGDAARTATLAAGRGAEVRFPFRRRAPTQARHDSATFRFDVTGGGDADAVRVSLPVRPDYHPRAHTIAGVLRDTATVELALPAGIDPDALAALPQPRHIAACDDSRHRGVAARLPVLLHRASGQRGDADHRALSRAATSGRCRERSSSRATSCAPSRCSRAVSAPTAASATGRPATGRARGSARTRGSCCSTRVRQASPWTRWCSTAWRRSSRRSCAASRSRCSRPSRAIGSVRELRLRERVAAVDFLSRLRRPEVASENELLRSAAILTLEDRARLAEVLARRAQMAAARRLMSATWAQVRVEGTRAVVPDTAIEPFYFESPDPSRSPEFCWRRSPSIRSTRSWVRSPRRSRNRGVRRERGGCGTRRTTRLPSTALAVARSAPSPAGRTHGSRAERESRDPASGASGRRPAAATRRSRSPGSCLTVANAPVLRVSLDAGAGQGAVYYYFTVTEVPLAPPVTPEDAGIRVERWYERFDGGAPITRIVEGELVRVRLRITVPSTRQFVVVDDALPAGLEAVDLSLRTASALPGPGDDDAGTGRARGAGRAAAVGLRALGRGMVVAVRLSRDSRRPRGVFGERALAGNVHGDVRRARDDAGNIHPPAGACGGDVQSGGERSERWGNVYRNPAGAVMTTGNREAGNPRNGG